MLGWGRGGSGVTRTAFLEKNLAILSKRDPKLAERVRSAGDKGHLKLIRTSAGHPDVLIRGEESRIAYYGAENPAEAARHYLEAMNIRVAPHLVFMGLGLGYHLDQFLKHLSRTWETKEIIVYEKDLSLFRLALGVGDYGGILNHPNIHFFAGDNPEDSLDSIHTKVFRREPYELRSLKIIPLPASVALHPDYYLRAKETVKKAARQLMISVGNDSFDSLLGLENMFVNLQFIFSTPGINLLKDRFKGKPGILVAGGPSLNKNMHLLAGLRDRALVFACDTSFLPMRKRGIRPHLVTSLERTPGTDLYYVGVDDYRDTYFIAPSVLMQETLEAFRGRKFTVHRWYPYYDWLENDKGSIVCGLSVANLVFRLLEYLGCDPIILVGQDLAYAEDGDTHVSGNVFGPRCEVTSAKPVIELEGNDGRPVKSEKMWEIMKFHYEQDLRNYGGTCINATEGGAKITGTTVMTLREAIDRHCREPFFPLATLNEAYENFKGQLDLDGEMRRILGKIRATRDVVEERIGQFEKAMNEATAVKKEIIQPYLEGKEDVVDLERLLAVERSWVFLSGNMVNDRNLYEITCQTMQAYDIWLMTELAFLKDLYRNREILSMARVLKMADWFGVTGSFLIFTRNVLNQAEKMIL